MENLPEEMMTEILAKHSVDSLMRLSCICKSWHDSIIGNSYLGEKQFNNNVSRSKDSSLIFLRCSRTNEGIRDDLFSSHRYPSPFTQERQTYEFNHVVGSCNGIICLAGDQSVYLYNPVTREDKKLPSKISGDKREYSGFGFDKSNDDYKVIIITKHVEVYRLSTNEWSILDLNLESEYYFLGDGHGVFLNGFCHWPVRGRPMMCPKTILTFDFHDETFGKMKYPGGLLCAHECIGVLDESLALCLSDPHEIKEVWVMTEYGKNESWTKRFSFRSSMTKTVAFWVHDMEIVLLGFYTHQDRRRLVSCSSKEGGCITLFEVRKDSNISGAVFEPTLVSLRRQHSKSTA